MGKSRAKNVAAHNLAIAVQTVKSVSHIRITALDSDLLTKFLIL